MISVNVNSGSIRNISDSKKKITGDVTENTIPFFSDLAFRTTRRNGLTLTDAYGNNATILPKCYINVSGGQIRGAGGELERVFDGDSYTLYFVFKQVEDVNVGGTDDVVSFGGATAGLRGIELRARFNSLRLYCGDGILSLTHDLVNNINTTLKDQGLHYFFLNVNYSTLRVTAGVYDSSNILVGAAANIDISGFVFNNNNNSETSRFYSEHFVIDNYKKFDAVKTLVQCQTDSYTDDLQIHLANVYSGADISGNGHDFSHLNILTTDLRYDNLTSWVMDYGFDRYSAGTDIYRDIPRDTDGDSYIPSRSVGATWGGSRIMGDRPGDDYFTNNPDCKIRFTHSFFDRSDAIIWGAAARTGYYDASNTKDFHISELNQRTLQGWLNDGYKGRLFVHMEDNSIEEWDRKQLREIFLYMTDKILTDHLTVLTYTEDRIAAILSNGNPTYSGNYIALGTLKTTKPMLTFRQDDAPVSAYTDWRGFFNSRGIDVVMGIHAAEVGTVGTYTYMSWAQLQTLAGEGWDVACHNNYDVDYNDQDQCDTAYSQMLIARTTQQSYGMPCWHYIGNRHSSANPGMGYLAHRARYKTHMAWGAYGKDGYNGANPQELDLYRLCGMACDLAGPYYLNDADNTAEIAACKAELDKCLANNRWAIMFVHNYVLKVATALDDIITYANTIGVDIVSIEEALENVVYG